MKTLLLARHAKASWGDATLADHDRPLAPRGEHDAPQMGERLAREGVRVDRIVTSTALRARTTAAALAAGLGVPDEHVTLDERLYGASVRMTLAIAAELQDDVDAVMLVGHEPTMSETVGDLTGEWHAMPTCAIAECTVASWAEVGEGTGTLVGVRTPGD